MDNSSHPLWQPRWAWKVSGKTLKVPVRDKFVVVTAAENSKQKTTAADVAAEQVVDAIEKNKPRLTIGQDAKIMDILSRLNPIKAADTIYKQMANLLG